MEWLASAFLFSESLKNIKTIYLAYFVLTKYNNTYWEGAKMEFMTTKEAAEKWKLTERIVQYYCKSEVVPGTVKVSGVWLIPKDAEKPIDRRRKNV